MSSNYAFLWLTRAVQIEVRVVFDRPVIVTGSPRLLLDTGGYAVYDGTFEDGTEVSAWDIFNRSTLSFRLFLDPFQLHLLQEFC